MMYAVMMALLVGCGEDTSSTTVKEEPPKVSSKIELAGETSKAHDAPSKMTSESEGKLVESKVSTARTGEQVYTQVCVTCHQANGEGMTGLYPPLAGSNWVAKSNETLIKIVLHGLMGEIEVKGVIYNNVMSPWGYALSDQEVANVLTYVRSSWGNTGGAVKAAEVKVVRETHKGHSTWTTTEL